MVGFQNLSSVTEGTIFSTLKCPPGLSSMGGGSIRNRAPSQSVLRVRADCGGRLFTAKLGIIVHYLPHQLLDHLLADDRILLTVFAIASMTSSASAVSTLPEPACPIPQSWSQEPVHVGGWRSELPGRVKR